jgi:serine/threonine protein kinase
MNFRVSETPFQAVNQYIVRELIGAGGMGTIYRAFDIQLRRDVALKVLNTLDPVSLERFVREREITADLDHPNFVRILSMGYLSTGEGQRPFYTMPLLRGITLADLIQRRLRTDEEGGKLRDEFTFSRLLQLVQQICLAMESAHARGIIHGDLKPTNVIIGSYGELYIVDMGLAKYVHDTDPGAAKDGETDLDTESPAGTPFYMAPEAIFDPGSADARTDIFGVGGILYYILTGVPPRYRPATSKQPAGGDPQMMGSRPDQSTDDVRPTDTASPYMRTTEKLPQWHEETGTSAGSSREVFLRALHGILVPPDQVAGRIPDKRGDTSPERVTEFVDPAVTSICMKALARKPADRYPGIRAMWQEIQQYLEGQFERILKREAADLTRTMSRQNVPVALRNYELAEQGLREKIVQKEKTGRFGLEEKLDLFDLLIDKAKIYEQRGDTVAIIRSVTRAEPILETALEVLQHQHIQLLIARGSAMTEQGDFAGAKSIFAWAIARSRSENLDELQADALRGFGIACAGLGTPADLAAGQKALENSIELADTAGNAAASVRGRLGLARLLMRSKSRARDARKRLGEALVRAGQDPALLCEANLALGAFHLSHREPTPALHQIETGLQHAREIDAKNLIREGHFLLGQTYHELGDPEARAKHFKLALMVRGLRRTDMERRLADFYAARKLDPTEIGLGNASPEATAAMPPRRRAGGPKVHSTPDGA